MTTSKLFAAKVVIRNGEYETLVNRLIRAESLQAADAYARGENGMPVFDGSDIEDDNSYQEDNANTWYFFGGEWCATLESITEIEDPEMAKQVIASGLVSFL